MMQSHQTGSTPFEILLVEDSPGDIRLTVEAFKDAKIHVNLKIATDGEGAMEFLRSERKGARKPHPDLILLDLNLPRKSGREVLEDIKADPQLKSIPVVILTTSASQRDVTQSYLLHANSYINKPVNLNGFLQVILSIDNFWLSVVRLPQEHTHDAKTGLDTSRNLHHGQAPGRRSSFPN